MNTDINNYAVFKNQRSRMKLWLTIYFAIAVSLHLFNKLVFVYSGFNDKYYLVLTSCANISLHGFKYVDSEITGGTNSTFIDAY